MTLPIDTSHIVLFLLLLAALGWGFTHKAKAGLLARQVGDFIRDKAMAEYQTLSKAAPPPAAPAASPPVAIPLASGGSGTLSVAPVDAPWPHLITVGDTHIMADAPISSSWQPSMMMYLMGHEAGTFVTDPSNPPGARSPAGYPVRDGRVLYGETSFNSDAAVMAYLQAQAQSNANATPAPGSYVP